MKDWFIEFLYVLSQSSRMQKALIVGFIAFFAIQVLGHFYIENIELQGSLAPVTESLVRKLTHKYDKAAWLILGTSFLAAYRFYRKDKNRF
jgi:hypothetical protein